MEGNMENRGLNENKSEGKIKILVVDDEEIICDLYKGFFGKLVPDWELIAKETIHDGLNYGLENVEELHALFLDGYLQPGFGWQIAEVLRKEGYKGLIFCVAGQSFDASVPVDKQYLYDGFFKKPIDFLDMVNELKKKF
jgi:hypothetical protein